MSRLISEESSCAKKLFLYEFLLSMLSYMNYVCIHSDNCLLSWAQVLQCLHRAEVLQDHHHIVLMRVNFYCCVMLVWVNFCCLFWLSSFRLSALVALMMLFTVKEHKNIFLFFLSLSFNFSFTWHQHQLPHCHYLITSFLLWKAYYNIYQSQISIMTSVSFICVFCVWYWHWLQSHSHDSACGCEKRITSSSVSVTLTKCAHVAAATLSSLSSEEVNSLHTSADSIFFSVIATLLTPHSCDSLIVLICFCCLQCSKVIVTLFDHKCEVMKNVQCNQCFKNCKACNSICKTLTKHHV